MSTANEPQRGRRALQAEQTPADILRSARLRFAEAGYAATSLKDIAADVGVSVQTVYDSVGTKPEVVRRLNDLIDAEADVGAIASRIGTETDPHLIVRIPALITRRLLERCGDILRACLSGALAEPELAPVLDEGNRRHRAGAAAVAQRLGDLGGLRKGVSKQSASTTIAALAETRLAIVLIDDYGFSLDELEDWIATTTAAAVLSGRS